MDRETFAHVRSGMMIERCPACGWASRYEWRDYYFVDPATGQRLH